MKRSSKIGLSLVVIIAIACIAITAVERMNIRKTRLYVHNFHPIPGLNTFVESAQRIYTGDLKVPHAVLLLHGYSSSPQEFEGLMARLEAAGIPYYAPQLTGFGLGDMHLLTKIRPSDWLRDAVFSYDILASFAKEVSVVGHSNGGVLAVYVAEHRPVKHLVLSSPYLAIGKGDKIFKTALSTPVVSTLMQTFIPVFSKGGSDKIETSKAEAAGPVFRYPTLPIRSLAALWILQDRVDISKANYKDLTLLYGKFDTTVDIPTVIERFNKHRLHYTATGYANSAHNIFEDADKEQALSDALRVLQQ